jgi:hypothetical protein
VIVLGQIHGKVAGGRHGKVRLKLGPAGMRLLRAHHKLRERLVLRVTDKAGKTKTVDYAITLRLS